MKKKIIFGAVVGLFALGVTLTTQINQKRATLASVETMVQAYHELVFSADVVSDEFHASTRKCKGADLYYCRGGGGGCNVSAQPICPHIDL